MYKNTLLAVLCALSMNSASYADPKPPALDKLRVLLLLDGFESKYAEGIKADGEDLREMFKFIFENDAFPKLQKKSVKIDTLGGKQKIAARDIEEYLNKNPVGADEAFFFYYSGVGSYDIKIKGGHILSLSSGESLARQDLHALFDRHVKSPLRIVVTESISISPVGLDGPDRGPIQIVDKAEGYFEDLFFRHRGTVDFNATSFGEPSLMFSSGSLMTEIFTRHIMMESLDQDLDTNSDGTATWLEVFTSVRKKTSEAFQGILNIAQDDPMNEIHKLRIQRPMLLSVAGMALAITGSFYVSADDVAANANMEKVGLTVFYSLDATKLAGLKIRVVLSLTEKDEDAVEKIAAKEFEIKPDPSMLPPASIRKLGELRSSIPFAKFAKFPEANKSAEYGATLKIYDAATSKLISQSWESNFEVRQPKR